MCQVLLYRITLRNSLRRYWLTLLNILKSANVKTQVKSCLSPKGITQFRCFSGVSASFNWEMVSSLSVLRPVFRGTQSWSDHRPRGIWTCAGWNRETKRSRQGVQRQFHFLSKNRLCLLRWVLRLKSLAQHKQVQEKHCDWDTFYGKLWLLLVEKATVGTDRKLTFTLRNGMEIEV